MERVTGVDLAERMVVRAEQLVANHRHGARAERKVVAVQ
jgi:hypothetical protein